MKTGILKLHSINNTPKKSSVMMQKYTFEMFVIKIHILAHVKNKKETSLYKYLMHFLQHHIK